MKKSSQQTYSLPIVILRTVRAVAEASGKKYGQVVAESVEAQHLAEFRRQAKIFRGHGGSE